MTIPITQSDLICHYRLIGYRRRKQVESFENENHDWLIKGRQLIICIV